MGRADRDDPKADAAGMRWALHHESADGIRYADSGVLPGDSLHLDGDSLHLDNASRPGSGQILGSGHFPEDGRICGSAPFPDGGHSPFPDSGQAPGATPFPAPAPFPDSGQAPGATPFPDGGWLGDDGQSPDSRSRMDTGTSAYPVIDRYGDCERFAGNQAAAAPQATREAPQATREAPQATREAPQATREQPFTRVYARPADPWQARLPGDGQKRARHRGRHRGPAIGYPAEPTRGGYSAAGYPYAVALSRRMARLRPDRWIVVGGSLAAAAAVIVAFVTSGGSAATTRTATVHVAQSACASPVPGR